MNIQKVPLVYKQAAAGGWGEAFTIRDFQDAMRSRNKKYVKITGCSANSINNA